MQIAITLRRYYPLFIELPYLLSFTLCMSHSNRQCRRRFPGRRIESLRSCPPWPVSYHHQPIDPTRGQRYCIMYVCLAPVSMNRLRHRFSLWYLSLARSPHTYLLYDHSIKPELKFGAFDDSLLNGALGDETEDADLLLLPNTMRSVLRL